MRMSVRGVPFRCAAAAALFLLACGGPERPNDTSGENAAVDAGADDAAVDAGADDGASGEPPCVEPATPPAACSVSGYWSGTLTDYLSNTTIPMTLELMEAEGGAPTGGVCGDISVSVRGEVNDSPASGGRSDDSLCLYVTGIGSDFLYRGTLSSACSSVSGSFTAESYSGSWSATWQSLCPP